MSSTFPSTPLSFGRPTISRMPTSQPSFLSASPNGPQAPNAYVNINKREELRRVKITIDTAAGDVDKEKATFEHRNDAGIVLDPTGFEYYYADGFASIQDFLTVFHPSDVGLNRVVCQVADSLHIETGLVDIEEILYKNFIHDVEFVSVPVTTYLLDHGFVRLLVNGSGIVYVKFSEKNLPYMFVRIAKRAARRNQIIEGSVTPEVRNDLVALLQPQMVAVKPPQLVHELTGFDERGEANFKLSELNEDMDYALAEFYPWITIDLVQYFQEFLDSRANVLVLIGCPGTGKSTFIRTMIKVMKLRALVAFQAEVITSPNFIKSCQRFLEMPSRDLEDDGKFQPTVAVIEDADELLAKRLAGNHQMSEILNATSGIASDTLSKFIFSTNLKDLDVIDPALLRPGRCFDIIPFRELNADEARIVRRARGLEDIELDKHRKYKLAEVLNDAITLKKVDAIVKPRFGFI